MAHAWDLVVVGGCNFDYLVRGAKLPSAGETILPGARGPTRLARASPIIAA